MKRLFYFLLVFTAIFVLSYNVWYFALRQAKATAWQEVLLKGGTLIDGSGGEPYGADILIRGKQIVAIGTGLRPSPGARVIDVRNSLVMPGIVATCPGLLPGEQKQGELAAAGVTTLIGGVNGSTPLDIKRYLSWAARSGIRINFGTLLGMGSLRGMLSNPEQMRRGDMGAIREGVKRGLSEGALGLSLDFNRLPDAFWSWDEIEEVCRGLYPAPLVVVNLPDEVCSEGDVFLQALQPLKKVAEETPFRPYLKNLRLPKRTSASQIQAIQHDLAQTASRGEQICGDLNPFSLKGGPRYMFDRAVARFGADDLIIAQAPSEFGDIVGESLAEASMERGVTLPAMIRELLGKGVQVEVDETGGEASLATLPLFCWQAGCGSLGEEDGVQVENYMKLLAEKKGRFGEIPLPEKVKRLTSLPARLFGLQGRGRIAVDYYADLLVLKKQGTGYAPDYVFVNGRPVLINGHITTFKAGHVLIRSQAL